MPRAPIDATRRPLAAAARRAPPPVFEDLPKGAVVHIRADPETPAADRIDDFTGTFDGEANGMVSIIDEDGVVVSIPRNLFDVGALSLATDTPAMPTPVHAEIYAPPDLHEDIRASLAQGQSPRTPIFPVADAARVWNNTPPAKRAAFVTEAG